MGAGKGIKERVKGKRKESKANIGFRKKKGKKRPTPLSDCESSGDEEVT